MRRFTIFIPEMHSKYDTPQKKQPSLDKTNEEYELRNLKG